MSFVQLSGRSWDGTEVVVVVVGNLGMYNQNDNRRSISNLLYIVILVYILSKLFKNEKIIL